MILATLTPSPEEILRCHTEECIIPIEKGQGLAAFKKIKMLGFSDTEPPLWIIKAMKYLTMTDFGNFSS
jgi:hypothetical protein